ncbi:MAG: FG-GAP repeat protein [Myxococcales bacterium]|nr:FG-GAP repeat protein [Myxococcales bacterium]
MGKRALLGVLGAISLAVACSEDESTNRKGDAGTTNGGAAGSSGSTSGGTANGGATNGGTTSGGTAGSSGSSSGGTAGGDASAGSAGMSSGGSAGAAGMDAGTCDPPPDAGCTTTIPSPQEAYLKTDVSEASLELGRAVAMDGNTIVAGSTGYPVGTTGAGAALVYTRDCNGWSLQAVLTPDNPGNDQFGRSVAISGDTIVIGAEDEDGPGESFSNSGAAYVFERCGSSWSQTAYLTASNAANNDRFGKQVAISGDVIVVGAPEEDSDATSINGDQTNDNAAQAGAAYVFRKGAGGWAQDAYLKASNAEQGDSFGDAVAISGSTILVTATGEDSPATGVNGNQGNDPSYISAGAVYAFVHDGSAWSQQAYIKASNTGANLNFGESLAIDGDTFVAGAIDENSDSTGVNGSQTSGVASSGAAYIFFRSGVTWTQQAFVKASNTGANDKFGTSVAISGDRVLIGAPNEDGSASGLGGDDTSDGTDAAGAAYLYTRNSGNWAFSTYIKASNPGIADLFGQGVAISGPSFVVSALFEDSGATGTNGDESDNSKGNSGALYVFKP